MRKLHPLVLPVLGCAAAGGPARAAERPNLVLFYVDDMGWQDTSVPFHTDVTALNRRYRTPNMERLAREGVMFTQAYQSAVCSPSRVSVMTGMNPARHHVTNWTKERDRSPDQDHPALTMPRWNLNGLCAVPGVDRTVVATPLPALLREAGYRTIHVGKAHLGARGTPGEDPRHLGFDVNIAGHAPGGPGSHYAAKNFSAAWRTNPPDHSWDVPGMEAYHGTDLYLTEALTREAIGQLDAAVAAGTPFFLHLSHYAVHAPFEKDDRYYQAYRDAGLDHRQATYASMIEGMDRSLGDVLDALRRLGVERETIVLFSSDNGSPRENDRNLPLRGHKVSPYEGGTRVPMIVRWPGVTAAGGVCATPVTAEDFFPTLLEMGGVPWRGRVRQTVDGASFVPLLRNETAGRDPDRPLVWHYPHFYGQQPYSSIRRGPWKLLYMHAGGTLELYNLEQDIGEETDLAAAQPERVRALAADLGRLLRERGAPMPAFKSDGRPVPWPDERVP